MRYTPGNLVSSFSSMQYLSFSDGFETDIIRGFCHSAPRSLAAFPLKSSRLANYSNNAKCHKTETIHHNHAEKNNMKSWLNSRRQIGMETAFNFDE